MLAVKLDIVTIRLGLTIRHGICVFACADISSGPLVTRYCAASSGWCQASSSLCCARLSQSSVKKLARRVGYGEVFAVEDPASVEVAERAQANAMADKLDARQEIGGLPFTSCAA